jgi:predicted RNase H-like HicB family nuclease
MGIRYTLEYWRDGGWYVGRIKEKPNVLSQAKTLKELERNIREAFLLILLCELETKPAKASRVFETGVRNITKPRLNGVSVARLSCAKKPRVRTARPK